MRGRFDLYALAYHPQATALQDNGQLITEMDFNYKTSFTMQNTQYTSIQNANIFQNQKQEIQTTSYPKHRSLPNTNLFFHKTRLNPNEDVHVHFNSRNYIDKRNNLPHQQFVQPFDVTVRGDNSNNNSASGTTYHHKKQHNINNNNSHYKNINEVLTQLQQKNIALHTYLKTQKGSRELQRQLYKISPVDIDNIIIHLSSIMHTLMRDKYGNYFCSKLIQNCSPEQRVKILETIKHSFGVIGNCVYGTHCIQIMVELSNMKNEQQLLGECIKHNAIALCCDQRGTHIVQKFLSNCNDESTLNELCDELLSHFHLVMNNPHGICVYIKMIKIPNTARMKPLLCDTISTAMFDVIRNPYGNYLIQSILEAGVYDVALTKAVNDVKEQVKEKFAVLAMQKYSSNVVEKTLMCFNKEEIMKMILGLVEDDCLENVLKNTYGNYVIEKVVGMLDGNERKRILDKIRYYNKDQQYLLLTALFN